MNVDGENRHGHIDISGEIQNPGGSCFTMYNILVALSSRGSLRLASSSSLDAPLIDPGLFTSPLVEALVYECTRITSNAINNSSAGRFYFGSTLQYLIST
jgi:hypothetical protein